jgi:hypothetical protein
MHFKGGGRDAIGQDVRNLSCQHGSCPLKTLLKAIPCLTSSRVLAGFTHTVKGMVLMKNVLTDTERGRIDTAVEVVYAYG